MTSVTTVKEPTIPDLWPSDIGQTNVLAPLSVLQQQACRLAEKTGGLVLAAIESVTERSSNFVHTFLLVAPTLNNYTVRIFRVKHGVHFYPLEIITEIDGPNFRAATQDDFLRALGEVFASAPLKKIIHSLIAQSRVATRSQPGQAPSQK